MEQYSLDYLVLFHIKTNYNLPKSRADLDKLLQRMKACGIDETKAMEIIKEKKVKYDKDCALFDSKWKWKSQPWTYVYD